MKKLVFASVMALASISLVYLPSLRAQDSDQITIKDPGEYNAYQNAITQSDPKAKATALESFLQTYPQSVVKKAVLDQLVDAYQAVNDADHILSAASRLLQVDPNNLKAILYSVLVKKSQCQRTGDAQTCDDAAALGRKGLAVQKPAATSDDDWKKLTSAAFPMFHSAIALDEILSKKDVKAAVDEYRTELMLYPTDATKSGPGLVDTLNLAEAYAKLTPPDAVNAVWFYARAVNFAPDSFKPAIEKKLDYWYKKYHGAMDGLDDIKTQTAANLFPPGGAPVIKAAATPAERIHDLLATTPDLKTLALADKETILAVGSKEDADKLWALMKDQQTPVPGTMMDGPVTALKVGITQAAKTNDFTVALKTPMTCKDMPSGAVVKDLKEFILANGVKDDTDKIEQLSPDYTKPVTKISIEGTISQVKVAVTQDAKDAKAADFIVNMKALTSCKEVPAVGSAFGLSAKGEAELDGTYDNFRQIAATPTTPQAAEIVLREGFIQAEKKKAAAPVRKPTPAHRPAH